jgi:hypothetical protein
MRSLKQKNTASARVKQDPVSSFLEEHGDLRGAKFSDVEKLADQKFLSRGWLKEPLRKGEGVRYTDGKGGSFQINRGYEKTMDDMHRGPYIKYTKIRKTEK